MKTLASAIDATTTRRRRLGFLQELNGAPVGSSRAADIWDRLCTALPPVEERDYEASDVVQAVYSTESGRYVRR